jgi:hypothetical protein
MTRAPRIRVDPRQYVDVHTVLVDGVMRHVEITHFRDGVAVGRVWSGHLGWGGRWAPDADDGRVVETPAGDLPRETTRLRIK